METKQKGDINCLYIPFGKYKIGRYINIIGGNNIIRVGICACQK